MKIDRCIFYRSFVISIILIMCLVGTLGCQQKAVTSITKENRLGKWGEDIDLLARELPNKHKNLFYRIKEEEFQDSIEDLKKNISNMNDEEIKMEITKILASIGDAHTGLRIKTNTYFPIKTYWFKEGIYVINTTQDYKNALYAKLVEINGIRIDDIEKILSRYISHENDAQLKKMIPGIIQLPDYLYGSKILPDKNTVAFTFEDKDHNQFKLDVKSIKVGEKVEYILNNADNKAVPLYLQNNKEFYWFKHISDKNAMYFQYNSCQEMKDNSFKSFVSEMFAICDEKHVEKLIIDLRMNGGGDSSIMEPFINELKKRKSNFKENSIYVIIGRNTFSSAILNAIELKNSTDALFVGEPTGGRPNHFGEVRSFHLKNSGLTVFYSSKYFKTYAEDVDSLMPDVLVELSFQDYYQHRDPVLDKILND